MVQKEKKPTDKLADKTALQVDSEIRKLIDDAYAKTREILTKHRKELDKLAKGLMEYETLTGDEIALLLKGKKIRTEEQQAAQMPPRPTVPDTTGSIA